MPTEDVRILERCDPDLEKHVAMIADEFRQGFLTVESIGVPGVTVFGSARTAEGDPWYENARSFGRLAVDAGFAVVTGGGPGVMEAANRGAQEAGGVSVGFNIQLPHEQDLNPYCDIGMTFRHFYARKTMLVKAAEALVLFPGRLRHARRALRGADPHPDGEGPDFPVCLLGCQHWQPLVDWLDELCERRLISREDLDLVSVTDDPAEAITVITAHYTRKVAA